MGERLDIAESDAFRQLGAVGGDPSLLPVPVRTVVVLASAQGVIDNGGLTFFFGADFPGQPPYDEFVAAYRRIGAETLAQCLEAAVQRFPFDEPHLRLAHRRRWLERRPGAFEELDERLCGAPEVVDLLERYVEVHADLFGRDAGGS